jgi:hypothetical protein
MSTDPEDDFLAGPVGDGLMAAGFVVGAVAYVVALVVSSVRRRLRPGR